MKLDKETIIAIAVCLLFLWAWPYIYKRQPAPQNPPVTVNDQNETDPEVTDKPSVKPEGTQSVETVSVETEKPDVEKITVKGSEVKTLDTVFLENEYIAVTIDPNKGNISSILLKKYYLNDKITLKKIEGKIALFKDVTEGTLGISPEDGDWIMTAVSLNTENEGTPTETVIVKRDFQTASGQLFAVTQKWSIKQDYIMSNSVEVTNLSDTPLILNKIIISAGGIEGISQLAGDKVFREEHEIAYYSVVDNNVKTQVADKDSSIWSMITGGGGKPKKGFTRIIETNAKWVGVVNKYFTCILFPEKPFDKGILQRSIVLKNNENKEYFVVETDGILDFGSIEPANSQSMAFTYYAGPKKMKMLKAFDPDASGIMKLYILGMSFLQPISRGMLYALMWLKDWCGSYGLSIILLTLIVKTLFWPITHRANVSMRKMQKIQPLIKELRKKYKDKPQQVNVEMMKLYKEHKVNPVGGCFPILLQMPVFFALYATLSSSVAPRHTSFLWMHDLSMPDTICNIPWTGIAINPLMLMMTGTMVLQQKMTPSAADPAQQKMMMFMPLIMLFMLYSLPSGLTLYWTVSQFISIAQLIVNKQIEKRAEMKEAGV